MKKKKPLTIEEHAALGRELKNAVDALGDMTLKLSRAYPAKVVDRALRASAAINKLRSVLDDQVYRENPGEDHKTLCRIYYPGDRQQAGAPSLAEAALLALQTIEASPLLVIHPSQREDAEDVTRILRAALTGQKEA